MNKLCCLIVMFITCGVCDAQNLVPNGDFEQYSGCPNGLTQLDSTLFWINPILSTPDYFNQCAPNVQFGVGVPNNTFGYQVAHSGGAYSGIGCFIKNSANSREYIEVQFISTLTSNVCYHFEMYVNLCNECQYTIDDLGVYFSATIISGIPNTLPLPFTPQINNMSGNTFDSLSWTLVSGNYTATGTENFLIIGNFKYDTNTDTTLINANGLYSIAYVYIDDVSLSPCTGIQEQNNNLRINISPNPFSNKIKIKTDDKEDLEIGFYDITSRKLFQKKFVNSTTLNTEQLAKGIYLYEVRNKNGVIKKGKVVKD